MSELAPFLKWAGGKRWLTHHPQFIIPKFRGRYIEPFVGSASVFFSLRPLRAVLSDANGELIDTYESVRDEPSKVVRNLRRHALRHSQKYYYFVRDQFRPTSLAGKAARFLYLNRTCWNGLYRVNLQGKFNVPKGTKTSVLLENDDFDAASAALQSTQLIQSDFEPIVNSAMDGDLIYADPPYTVRHNVNGFVKYNEVLFSWNDQVRLHASLCRAQKRGVPSLHDCGFAASLSGYPSPTTERRGRPFWRVAFLVALGGKADTGRDAQNDLPDPQRHFAIAHCCTAKGSFDHFVGATDKQKRDGEVERPVKGNAIQVPSQIPVCGQNCSDCPP